MTDATNARYAVAESKDNGASSDLSGMSMSAPEAGSSVLFESAGSAMSGEFSAAIPTTAWQEETSAATVEDGLSASLTADLIPDELFLDGALQTQDATFSFNAFLADDAMPAAEETQAAGDASFGMLLADADADALLADGSDFSAADLSVLAETLAGYGLEGGDADTLVSDAMNLDLAASEDISFADASAFVSPDEGGFVSLDIQDDTPLFSDDMIAADISPLEDSMIASMDSGISTMLAVDAEAAALCYSM